MANCRSKKPAINPTVKGALDYLKENYQGQEYPSESQTRRFLFSPEIKGAKTADLLEYGFFRWPESMEDGSLPWEASSALLELLAFLHKMGRGRPLNRNAKWFWRVTQAAPGAGFPLRWLSACQLALLEVQGQGGSEHTRSLEWSLAYRFWESETAMRLYAKKVREGLGVEPRTAREAEIIPVPFRALLSLHPDGGFEQLEEEWDALMGVTHGEQESLRATLRRGREVTEEEVEEIEKGFLYYLTTHEPEQPETGESRQSDSEEGADGKA